MEEFHYILFHEPPTIYTDTGEEIHFRIGAVADPDENSKIDDVTWRSYLKTGTLTVHSDRTISVKWDKDTITLKSHISEKGRGVELSELIVFNGKLYTIDDRSGIGELCRSECTLISVHSFTLVGVGWNFVLEYSLCIMIAEAYTLPDTANFSCVRKSRIVWTFTQVLKSLFLVTETIRARSCSKAKQVDV